MGQRTKISLGYKKIESLLLPQGIGLPSSARQGKMPSFALITPESGPVRWRDDGVAPTPTEGMPLSAGSTMIYDGNLAKIQFVAQLPSAKLNITFYE
jgi:hypothetical protein